jgi:AcrR family transcriptional regulator
MSKVVKKSQNDYRHGDLKAALISAAISKIAKSGEVDFTLRELSQKIGVTHTAAYRHFSSKKEILIAVADEGFSKLSSIFRRIVEKDPFDIEGLGVAYVEFATANPEHFKVMFHPDVKAVEPCPPSAPSGSQTFSYLLASVEANKNRGRFVDQDSNLIAMTAWAGVHGLATLIVNESLDQKMKIETQMMAKILTKNMMSGFLKRT